MSILSFPRINFRGVFACNPVTSNNDDVMPAVNERDLDSLGINVAGMTDDQASAYLREQVTMANDSSSPCRPYIRSGWNLYGDYTTVFDNDPTQDGTGARVTSVVTGPNARATTVDADALIEQPVFLMGSVSDDPNRRGTAMMCDLDATGLVTTQIWVGGLRIGGLTLNHDTRCYQNWLNFFSTVGSYGGEQNFVGIGCVWQFGISASAIPSSVDTASPALSALLDRARSAAGLAVRFRCFEVEPIHTSTTLSKAYQDGGGLPNPAIGYLVGTIGVWEAAEPESEVPGRKLISPFPRPVMTWSGGPKLPPVETPWQANMPPSLVGNSVAQVQPSGNVISIDLVEAFPKLAFRNPNGPEQPDSGGFGAPRNKADLGPMELAVLPANGGAAISIASIDYGLTNYATYQNFGGIIDVSYDPKLAGDIASGVLVVQAAAGNTINPPGTRMLQETPIRVITDDRALYLAPGTTPKPVGVKVYDRGGPTKTDIPLFLYEYFNIVVPKFGACDAPGQAGVRPNQTVAQDTRRLLTFPPSVVIPAGQGFSDWFRIPISIESSGATLLSYQIDPTVFGTGNTFDQEGAQGVTGALCWSYATYSSVRVYQNEDFSALYAKGKLQWEDVYNTALRYYFLLFPAMSARIPLNDEQSIVSSAPEIRQRLNTPDEPRFYTTYNMPPTRTMSPAKVKLILDFLDQSNPTPTTLASSATEPRK